MNNPTTSLLIPRIKAFAIDYLIILIYVGSLFGVTVFFAKIFALRLNSAGTTTSELLGCLTLTLPVILYFTVSEAGRGCGTIGKQKFGLKVVSVKLIAASFLQLLVRNFIKFLPWEIAHFFIYQLFYFVRSDIQPPGWVLAGLIGSQVMAAIYLLFIIFNKNNRSIYEIASHTRVVRDSIMKSE